MLVSFVALLLCLSSLLIVLYKWNELPDTMHSFAWYLLISFAGDYCGIIGAKIFRHNLVTNSIYGLVLLPVLYLMFSKIYVKQTHVQLVKYLFGIGTLAFLVLWIKKGFWESNDYGFVLTNILIVFACLLYLVDLAFNIKEDDLLRDSFILIIVGFLILHSTVFVVNLTRGNLLSMEGYFMLAEVKFIYLCLFQVLVLSSIYFKLKPSRD